MTKLFKAGGVLVSYDFDLFVIGAGSGGVRAARMSSSMGAKVAVAENLYLGGTCVNVGCVPKKIFVYGSEYSEHAEASKGFGWRMSIDGFDWPTLRDNKSSEISRLNGIYKNILENAGVEIKHGFAKFVDAHTVDVDGQRYSADKILIATGGWPNKPTFDGAEHVITSNDVFSLDVLPKRVLVQGGGYIAVEFAGIFNGLGCETELIYRKDMFLRGFDKEIREFVAEQVANKGVNLEFNTDIVSIQKLNTGELEVQLTTGEKRIVDAVFSAIGRHPKVEGMGLEHAGVKLDERGFIAVNDNFETSVNNIYAIGDVIGGLALTPVALAEGMALARHWYANQPLKLDYTNIATAIFCQPNIGTVGLSEEAALEEDYDIEVYASKFTPMKHTISGQAEKTFMKMIVDKSTDKVIGVHMVGADAGEIIQGIAIAMKAGATKAVFDSTIGIHPTAAEEFVTMRTPR
jgi:glutathione reductase (NADPH)